MSIINPEKPLAPYKVRGVLSEIIASDNPNSKELLAYLYGSLAVHIAKNHPNEVKYIKLYEDKALAMYNNGNLLNLVNKCKENQKK